MLCNISQNAMGQTLGGGTLPGPAGGGGYPARSCWGYPAGGTLPGGGTLQGVPYWGGGTLLGGTLLGVVPCWGLPWSGTPPPQPGQDGGGVPCPGGGGPCPGGYPGRSRTTEGVLNAWRTVCLLRSRRRTVLL